MTKLSIVVPVYNTEKYLSTAIDSILNQSFQDFEIICVNDGSTDKSGEILDQYATADNRIRAIHKDNAGYGAAVNTGFDNATGEYIAIVEPDDYILPDMYSTLCTIADEENVDFIKADYYRFKGYGDEEQRELWLMDSEKKYYNQCINPQKNINAFNFQMHTWAGIYNRKDFIEKYHIRHNETPGASYQDTGFWFQTLCNAKKIYLVNEPFYMYRVDNPNASIKNSTKVYALNKEYDFIYKFLKEHPDTYQKFIPIFWYRKYCSYLWNVYRIDKKFKKEFIKVFKNEYIEAYKKGEIDESLFPETDLKILHNIIYHPNKFYNNITNTTSFLQKIFSIINRDNHKVITILGIKIKLRRKNAKG